MSRKNDAIVSLPGLLLGRIDSKAGRAVGNALAAYAAGLLASRSAVFSGLEPFGVAAVAAASKSNGLFVLLGVVSGCLLPGGSEYTARYIAGAVAAFIFMWIFSSFESVAAHPAFAPAVAGVSSLVTGLAVVASAGTILYGTALCFAEAILSACAAAFFKKGLPLLRHPSRLWCVDRLSLVCVVITYCTLLLSLSRITLSGISLGRVIGILSLLIAARYGGEAAGSIAGASLGLIMGLGDKSMAQVLGGYAFGGLIAGVFSPLGRFACTASFILANAVACVSIGGTAPVLTGLYEVLAATMIFMVLPEKWLCRFSTVFVPVRESTHTSAPSAHGDAPARLFDAASALGEVSETVSQLGEKLRDLWDDDVSQVYSDAADITCKHCGMRMYCWGTAYNDTMDTLNDMTETLRKNRSLTRDDVPHHFAGRCCRLGELISSINRCYAEFNARNRASRKIGQLRCLLTDEFSGLATFLRDLGTRIKSSACADLGNDSVRTVFSACGLNVKEAHCLMDEKGHMTIEADIEKRGKTVINKAELTGELNSIYGRKFDGPLVSGAGETLTLSFREKPALSVVFGKFSVAKNGEKLCGDAADTFMGDDGSAVMILSDGMGCGGSAAVDSNLTVGLMSRLLRSGFGFDTAAAVVNSAMMLKSSDETFATLDVASVDLFTGEAQIIKAGAPHTYLRRCGRVERVNKTSLPIGILRGVKLEKTEVRMRRGDLIVMVSDGVLAEDDAWLVREIEQFSGRSADEFAQSLAEAAKNIRKDGHDDDITVMVAAIV